METRMKSSYILSLCPFCSEGCILMWWKQSILMMLLLKDLKVTVSCTKSAANERGIKRRILGTQQDIQSEL